MLQFPDSLTCLEVWSVQDVNDIKKEIVEMCDAMSALFNGLSSYISEAPSDDRAELVQRWQDYFLEHGDEVVKFSIVKHSMDDLKTYFVCKGVLKYES